MQEQLPRRQLFVAHHFGIRSGGGMVAVKPKIYRHIETS
jgi:hypothetical protein